MYKSGYSVLLMTIIISAAGLVLALNSLSISTQSAKNNIDITEFVQSKNKARSCTEIALQKIKSYRFYGGDETIPTQSCRIFTIKNESDGTIIHVKSGNFIMETKLKQINPKIIIDYQKQITEDVLDQNNPYLINPLALRLWLKADRAEYNDKQPVISISNSTDDIINFAQLENASELAPTLVTNVINNRPILRFDGINDFLTSTTSSIHTTEGLSIIVVGKSNSNNTNQTYIGKFNTTTNLKEWRLQNDEFNIVNDTVTLGDPNNNTTNFKIITAIWEPNSPQLSISLNNSTIYTNTGTNIIAITQEPIIVGSFLQGSTGFLNGDIAELLVFNKKLTTDELNKVRAYMNTKYQIYP